MAIEANSQEYTFDDTGVRRGIAVLRCMIAVAYFVLVWTGVLDVRGAWFWAAGAVVVAGESTNAYLSLHVSAGRLPAAIRYLDALVVSVVLVALHDITNPIWAFYLTTIVGAAHFSTQREMSTFVLVCIGSYAGVVATTAALGHDVSWGYAIIVSMLIFFMGLSSGIIAGGEQRMRMLVAEAASTDSLTGLANRRRFQEQYMYTLEEAVAKKVPLSLMLLDVDHFKEINDEFGHPAGDDKLREVAGALESVVRRGDLVARYGGDEFVVIAPHAAIDDAMGLAERLRLAAQNCGASLSIGVAQFPQDARTGERLIAAADGALYRAKQSGRNCVRMATPAAA